MSMKTADQKAQALLRKTVEDLRCSLDAETDPAVLELALSLADKGAGYGTGVTAKKMIKARINKLKKEALVCQE